MQVKEKISHAKKRIKELMYLIMGWEKEEQNLTKDPRIENYYQQLAALQDAFWFDNLDMKEFLVRDEAIKKRIQELEK